MRKTLNPQTPEMPFYSRPDGPVVACRGAGQPWVVGGLYRDVAPNP